MSNLWAALLEATMKFHEQQKAEGRCPSCGRLPTEPAPWAICAEFHEAK